MACHWAADAGPTPDIVSGGCPLDLELCSLPVGYWQCAAKSSLVPRRPLLEPDANDVPVFFGKKTSDNNSKSCSASWTALAWKNHNSMVAMPSHARPKSQHE